MSTYDITEGRANRAIANDLGLAQSAGALWYNTGIDFDIAIGGLPFMLDATEAHPYERGTAPFRKQQFDSQRDPGEQSLQGWWVRSQSSFHAGEGITFYDPFANPFSTTLASNSYRYANSLAVEPFDTLGQVTLLRRPFKTQNTSSATKIQTVSVSGVDKILMKDDGNVYLTDGTISGMTTLSAGVATTVYDMCNDGLHAYYIDASHIVSVALTGGATSAVRNVSGVTSAAMNYVKQRLVVGINNVLYEVPTTGGGGALPSPVYTHPNTSWVWTSITESGTAIYASGYSGTNSAVYKFTLDTAGAMPILTSAITAIVVPDGEIIHEIFVHLMTYMGIATNKGIRIAQVDVNGDLTYGPLLIYTKRPVRGMAAGNSYIYAATSFDFLEEGNYYPGIYKIDLSNEIDTLRFAVTTHIYADDITSGEAVDVCYLGKSNQLAFIVGNTSDAVTKAAGLGLYVQSATELYPTGWIETGYIRYNTLELKHFKRIVGRGDFAIDPSPALPTGATKGSMTISSKNDKGNYFPIVTYDSLIGTPEATITNPSDAQDAIALRFTLNRDATDITLSPVFKGYQLKAVPATPRTRIIKLPLLCFDKETDKYNSTVGYEGAAIDRLFALEDMESVGDVVTLQDFRTGETVQCLIEDLSFINKVSPDKKLTNFAGTVVITVRTVS